MKIRFALAAITALNTAPAIAAEPGPYFGLNAGITIPANSTPNILEPARALHEVNTSFSPGWNVNGAVGYKYTAGYRTELEVGYRQASLSKMDQGAATGHQGTLSVMGNIVVDISKGDGFQPYIGGGVGAGWMKWHQVQAAASAGLPAGTAVFDDGSPTVFQYQGIVGASFSLRPGTDLFFDYRYVGTTAASFDSTTPTGSHFSEHKDGSHNIIVGIRFPFGALP